MAASGPRPDPTINTKPDGLVLEKTSTPFGRRTEESNSTSKPRPSISHRNVRTVVMVPPRWDSGATGMVRCLAAGRKLPDICLAGPLLERH